MLLSVVRTSIVARGANLSSVAISHIPSTNLGYESPITVDSKVPQPVNLRDLLQTQTNKDRILREFVWKTIGDAKLDATTEKKLKWAIQKNKAWCYSSMLGCAGIYTGIVGTVVGGMAYAAIANPVSLMVTLPTLLFLIDMHFFDLEEHISSVRRWHYHDLAIIKSWSDIEEKMKQTSSRIVEATPTELPSRLEL